MTDVSKTITSGTVSIEDGLKAKEEYAPARKVKVELAFGVPDGADGTHFLNGVTQIAEAKVAELLGRAPKPNQPAAIADKQATITTPAAKPAKIEKAAKPKAPEKTKADLEAEMLAEASGPAAEPEIAADDDNLDDILGEAAPDPITDKQLSDACVAKAAANSKVAGWEPKKIRALIEEFTGAPGKHNREIPAEKRPDFLKRLEALK